MAMKVPEFLFPIANPIMTLLLNSPLHGLMSGSILVLYFTGRRSGRALSTPARYCEADDELVLITNPETRWWPNFLEGAEAEVQLRGKRVKVVAKSTRGPAPQVGARVEQMLEAHPADAVYMDVEKDTAASREAGKPIWDTATLDAAKARLVAVVLTKRKA
ncbi:MAG: nitroreductase/quinone reductase family protein [Pseudomonadota bacterium]